MIMHAVTSILALTHIVHINTLYTNNYFDYTFIYQQITGYGHVPKAGKWILVTPNLPTNIVPTNIA